jgi:hypothetical protein
VFYRLLGVFSIVQQQCDAAASVMPPSEPTMQLRTQARGVLQRFVWPWLQVTVMTVVSAAIFFSAEIQRLYATA